MSSPALIAIISLIIIASLYSWVSREVRRRENGYDDVKAVEAGPSGDASAKALNSMSRKERAFEIQLQPGRTVSTSDYLRILVVGNCMKPRNILDGEEWLVEPVDHQRIKPSDLKAKSVLLINIPDKGILKIREFEGLTENGDLKTLWYRPDGTPSYSSRPHSWENVKGIVRYSI